MKFTLDIFSDNHQPKLVVQYPRYHGQFNYSPSAPVAYVPAIYPKKKNQRQPRMGTKAKPSSSVTTMPAYVIPQPGYNT